MLTFPLQPEPPRPPEEFRPPHVEFLGEKTGPVEDDLKARFRHAFREFAGVRRAYLAILSYDEPSSGYSVGLCIVSAAGMDQLLLERVRAIFAEMFNSQEHLDVLFMRDDQEQQLRNVCGPFYEASEIGTTEVYPAGLSF